jgi:hypothetical protein
MQSKLAFILFGLDRSVLPGTSGNVTWTKKSDAEYAIDGPECPQKQCDRLFRVVSGRW